MMNNSTILTIALLMLVLACARPEKKTVSEFDFYTPDSIHVYGDIYEYDKTGPSILLFHQGGSNTRAEYQNIIPELTSKGYNIITIDQRRGGQTYGSYNRTVAEIPVNNYGYCDAYSEVSQTLDLAIEKGFTGKKILWGSSYSAALVIKLANDRPEDVDGVLAFSPASGEPMAGCDPNEYFGDLKLPLLVLRPENEMEYQSVATQFELAKEAGHQTYVADPGVHGSSMLVHDRVLGDVSETWKVVNTFLEQLTSDTAN